MATALPDLSLHGPLDQFDMALPVTRHALMPDDEGFEYLLSGIDSLDIGLYVHWQRNQWPSILDRLQECKERSQKKKGLRDQMPDGRHFLHLPTGKQPNYRFHLQYPTYHIWIGITNPPANSPNVFTSINAKSLWFDGVAKTVEQLTKDIGTIGGRVKLLQPSRCDLSADFYLPGDPSLQFIEKHKVARSNKISHHADSGRLETFYAGARGADLLMRIYDKGLEIKNSDKDWFHDLWQRKDSVGIWRVEFQLRRNALKKWGIESIEDLTEKAGGLWCYLTNDWFSLRHHDNERQNRRTVLPWWQSIQTAPEGFGEFRGLERPIPKDRLGTLDWFVSHIGGCLTSYAARRGVSSLEEAMNMLQRDMGAYWFERDFSDVLKTKILKLGNDLKGEGKNDGKVPELYLFG